MRKNLSHLSVLALVSVSLSGGIASAQAPVTFLQLRQVTSGQQAFTLTNAGSNSSISVAQVGASFDGFSANINGVRTVVNLTITGDPVITSSAATASNGSGGIRFLSQEFKNLQFRVASVLTPAQNILTVNASSAILFGTAGATSATFLRSNTDVGNPSVVFTSDVFDLAGSTERAFSFGFSSVEPNMMLGANGFVNSFNAAGVGTFSSNGGGLVGADATPEPSAIAFAGIMGAGLAGMVVRGRRRK